MPYLLTLALAGTALAGVLSSLPDHIQPQTRAGTYRYLLDLNGSGETDTLLTVSLSGTQLPESIAGYDPWFDAPVASEGEKLALLFTGDFAEGTFLVHDSLFFSSPIWTLSEELPIAVVRRGTEEHEIWSRKVEDLSGDALAIGTEAGIDVLLYLRDGRPRIHWPSEAP